MFRPLLILILICSQYQIQAQSDTLNQTDNNGLKQGYWIFYGKHFPEKGYCDFCKVEEGNYTNGRKVGSWVFYHINDTIPKLIGTFENGRPSGPYKKYYPSGKIMEEGVYINGKPFGEYKRYYESGCLAIQKFFNEQGKEDETSHIYNDDCDLKVNNFGSVRFKYNTPRNSVEINTSECNWHYTKVKETKTRNDSLEKSNNDFNESLYIDSLCSSGGTCIFKDGKTFDPNGLNRIYNKSNDLLIDGEFKDGYLLNGKIFEYDSDGILLKIEIWKNGTYCCDGQL